MKRFKLIKFICLNFIVIVSMLFAFNTNINASNLNSCISSITANQVDNCQPGQPIKITYNWKLPKGEKIKAGDDIEVTLPTGTSDHVGIEPNPEPFIIYGTYQNKKVPMAKLTTDGQNVKLVFTKYAELENMNRGSFTIAGQITNPSIQHGGTVQKILDWGVPSEVPTPSIRVNIPKMTPVPAPDLTPGISKMGMEVNSQVEWMIIGVTPNATGKVVINDILGNGQNYDPSNWEFGYTTQDGHRSPTYTLKEFEDMNFGKVSFDDNHMIIKLNGARLNNCQWVVSYFTKVTDDNLSQYINNASVSYQEGKQGSAGIINKIMTLPNGPAVAKNNDKVSGNIHGNGNISFAKIDEYGDPVKGAIFKLIDSKDNHIVLNNIKDTNGMININDLNNGDYLLEEIKVPKGYQKATGVHIKVVDNIARAINAPGNIIIDKHNPISSQKSSSKEVSSSSKKAEVAKSSSKEVSSSSKKAEAAKSSSKVSSSSKKAEAAKSSSKVSSSSKKTEAAKSSSKENSSSKKTEAAKSSSKEVSSSSKKTEAAKSSIKVSSSSKKTEAAKSSSKESSSSKKAEAAKSSGKVSSSSKKAEAAKSSSKEVSSSSKKAEVAKSSSKESSSSKKAEVAKSSSKEVSSSSKKAEVAESSSKESSSSKKTEAAKSSSKESSSSKKAEVAESSSKESSSSKKAEAAKSSSIKKPVKPGISSVAVSKNTQVTSYKNSKTNSSVPVTVNSKTNTTVESSVSSMIQVGSNSTSIVNKPTLVSSEKNISVTSYSSVKEDHSIPVNISSVIHDYSQSNKPSSSQTSLSGTSSSDSHNSGKVAVITGNENHGQGSQEAQGNKSGKGTGKGQGEDLPQTGETEMATAAVIGTIVLGIAGATVLRKNK